MILDFDSYIINESSLKKLKREVHGVLNMSARKRMRKELRDNIITFKFKKRNGDIRTAHGTLHPDYLPALKGGAPRPEHQMVYYDLDKEGWRSFRSFKFIKILNVKPVTSTSKTSTKPVSKPVHTEEDEDEEVKKTTSAKETEKEVEKEEHTKEKEEKKKVREIDDEIEDDDDKKSVLDDKDTPEEEEEIKKDKEKEKEEKEKEEKDDKEKDEDEEKKKTNESVTPVEEYPNVTVLGDGEYDGALWGHCFVYEGQKYYSECGWKNIFPSYCKMVIENGKAWAHQVDIYQRESLKKLYQ